MALFSFSFSVPSLSEMCASAELGCGPACLLQLRPDCLMQLACLIAYTRPFFCRCRRRRYIFGRIYPSVPGKSVWSGVSDRLTAGIAIRLSLLIISGSRGFAHFWRPGWAVRRGLLGGRLHHRLHSKMCYQRQVEERQQGAGCSSRNAPAFDGKQASTAARADS